MCDLNVKYLNYETAQVILGGMFFNEFYTAFTNDYSSLSTITQTVSLFVGSNSLYSPYIGNTVLPVGPSPFSPNIDDPTSGNSTNTLLLICLCVGGGLLLILLLLLLLIFCKDKEKADHEIVYSTLPEAKSVVVPKAPIKKPRGRR